MQEKVKLVVVTEVKNKNIQLSTRSYNRPQNWAFNISNGELFNGDLDEMIDSLITADTAEKLKGSEEE